MTFPSWPHYDEETIKIVSDVLRSGKVNHWTGNICRDFEKKFASYCQVDHAMAVANGTVAIDLALIGCNIKPGDQVIVTPRSFIASVSCVSLRGATPVFADVDPETQNITAETIKAVITEKTKAIIVVHLAGLPCDMDPILALAKKHNLKVIEDCAQAHGARYKGRPVGCMGDIGTFSFCQDKIMSTGGEGGMVVTNDRAAYEKMWAFKEHGKNRDKALFPPKEAGYRWLHDSLGTNYRMTEMQAAIGRYQLTKLNEWVEIRRQLAGEFNKSLKNIGGIKTYTPASDYYHSYYKYYFFLDQDFFEDMEKTKQHILTEMKNKGVPCFYGSCSEMYKEKGFQGLFQAQVSLQNAERLGGSALMFPVHPGIEEKDVHYLCRQLKGVLG